MPDYDPNLDWPPPGWDFPTDITPGYADVADLSGLAAEPPLYDPYSNPELGIPSYEAPVDQQVNLDQALAPTAPVPEFQSASADSLAPVPAYRPDLAGEGVSSQYADAVAANTEQNAGLKPIADLFGVDVGYRAPVNYDGLSAWEKGVQIANLPVDQRAKIEFDIAEEQKLRNDELVRQAVELEDRKQQAILDRREARMKAADEAELRVTKQVEELSADGGYFKNMNGLGKIATVLSVLAGGFTAQRNGGPNLALEQINKEIDQAVGVAKFKIAEGKGQVARMRASAQDDYEFDTSLRLAASRTVQQKLITEMQNYDPAGTQARRAAGTIDQLRQQDAQMMAEQRKAAESSFVKRVELEGKLLDNAKKAADLKKAQGYGLGGGGAKTPTRTAIIAAAPVELREKLENSLPADFGGSYSDALSTLDKTGKILGEERTTQLAAIKDYDKNGKEVPFVPKVTPQELPGLRDSIASSTEAINLIDEAMSIRTGGSSDWANSAENQRLKSIMGKLLLTVKNAEKLGQITENDTSMIEGYIGTSDFTKWRELKDSVAQARRNIEQGMKVKLRAAGLSDRALREFNVKNPYGHGLKPNARDKHNADADKRNKDDITKQSTPEFKRDTTTGEVLFSPPVTDPFRPVPITDRRVVVKDGKTIVVDASGKEVKE